ncbi:hypothetical protein AVEN_263106-1 [Araneus ventricosus]|uniref:Uncharacterized protein n=1 Tax=Araneus ventricosus TaxID=182803 RepID=A0A4Y2QAN2_ARAVE|nr:hypothetical protein AVEN_263106-1 [Araneus ventricosus]
MAVLPPLEKRILQSRESDADAEMSSSSASEEDAPQGLTFFRLKPCVGRAWRPVRRKVGSWGPFAFPLAYASP